MSVDPEGDDVGVAEREPLRGNEQPGLAQCLVDGLLPPLDFLPRVPARAKHDVVPILLKDRANHRLHLAARNHLQPGLGRPDPAGLQLELAEARGQEPGASPPALPGDASILPAVARVDVAGHVDAVERNPVRLGLDAQEPTQELVKLFRAETLDILALYLKGRGSPGACWRSFIPAKHPHRLGMSFQHAEQADRGRPGPHAPRLVLGECPWPTPKERSGLLLGETQPLADRPNPVGRHVLLRGSKCLYSTICNR